MRDDANGEFNARLQQAFGDVLIPTESVVYEKEVMRTRADKLDKGTAVAVVVKVENE
jgi:hypothetical protein